MKKAVLFSIVLLNVVFSQEFMSVHKQHKEEFGSEIKIQDQLNKNAEIIPLNLDKANLLNKAVFGFLPDWEYQSARSNLKYNYLTHIAAFDFAASSTGSISNPSYWPWTDVINAAHSNGVKIIMAITNFNKDNIRTILTTTSVKNTFFANIKSKIETYNLDGVNIDFEGPYTADRGSLMNGFMAELTNYVHTNLPGKEVSFDGPVVNWSGWDFVGLANSCDYIFIMGYDFYGSWSTESGPSSPLSGSTYNVGNSLTNASWGYANVVASNPNKLILGIPYYGCHWTTQTSSANSTVISYVGSTRFKDDYGNAQIYGRQWHSSYQVPWYRYQQSTTWHQVWYDDDQSLGLKYDLAVTKNLKGVGMWALNYDGTRLELWNLLRDKFYYDVPVELLAFNVEQSNSNINLEWQTATETNNLGFEIQRAILSLNDDAADVQFPTIGFVKGSGTTTEPKSYSFSDNIINLNCAKVAYRLKQIDSNGSYKIYDAKVISFAPFKYSLSQNYPNPFNPETKIDFQLPTAENVTLTLFDVLGREVATIINEVRQAGYHSVKLDANNLTAGVYLYRLKTSSFTEVKKMVVAK